MLMLMSRLVEVVRENLEAQPVGENRVADFLPTLTIFCPVAHAHLNIAKDCLLTLVKSRLALGSPDCSGVCFTVIMLKTDTGYCC